MALNNTTNTFKSLITLASYSLLASSAFASDDGSQSVDQQVSEGGPAYNASEPGTKKCRTETFPEVTNY